MPCFSFQGQRVAYTEFGGGPGTIAGTGSRGGGAAIPSRPLILIHGLLLSQQMHGPLARDLAVRGNRVITLDLLGHGASERPREMWRYSMSQFAEQALALIDHLELEQAAVMGTSLGANTALEMAVASPGRLRALVIEMPVLDNALLASAVAFAPLLVALSLAEPVMALLARGARAVPRRLLPFYGNVALDAVRQDPGPSAAVLQGLFFGRIAPDRAVRRTLQTPALVIGHPRDPLHPFSDAGMLAGEMPNARLLQASSLMELRLRPQRLTDQIADFLDEAWRAGDRRPARTRTTSASAAPVAARRRRRKGEATAGSGAADAP